MVSRRRFMIVYSERGMRGQKAREGASTRRNRIFQIRAETEVLSAA